MRTDDRVSARDQPARWCHYFADRACHARGDDTGASRRRAPSRRSDRQRRTGTNSARASRARMLSRHGRGNMSALLEVRDLDVFYETAQALSGVSLDVPQGEIVAIVGANGAGKSTLIRAVAGIECLRAGRISFSGRDLAGLDSHEICNLGIGQVAEGRTPFPPP